MEKAANPNQIHLRIACSRSKVVRTVKQTMNNKENNQSSFFALVFRQKYIKRWGLMHSFVHETLAQHSSECAMIAHALATIGNELFGKSYDVGAVVSAALFHDVPEVFTGDMPTPVKYANEKIREEFGEIENETVKSLVSKLPTELQNTYFELFSDEDPEIHALVKAADRLCAYIKCAEELKFNNSEFSAAKVGIEQKLKESDMPEVKYFMESFIPAFDLTLDEQQK